MATRFAEAPPRGLAKRRKSKPVEAAAPTQPTCQPVSLDTIRLRAYLMWVGAGKPLGDGVDFWLEAERELLNGK